MLNEDLEMINVFNLYPPNYARGRSAVRGRHVAVAYLARFHALVQSTRLRKFQALMRFRNPCPAALICFSRSFSHCACLRVRRYRVCIAALAARLIHAWSGRWRSICMPCLAFSALTRLNVSPTAFVEMVGAYGLVLACFLAIGLTTIWIMKVPAHTYLPVFTSSNTGNMGLPLCLFAFGPEGLALGICIFVMSSIFSFTVGWSIYAGRLAADVLYNNPLIYAVLARRL